jgi:hypothetical protein
VGAAAAAACGVLVSLPKRILTLSQGPFTDSSLEGKTFMPGTALPALASRVLQLPPHSSPAH